MWAEKAWEFEELHNGNLRVTSQTNIIANVVWQGGYGVNNGILTEIKPAGSSNPACESKHIYLLFTTFMLLVVKMWWTFTLIMASIYFLFKCIYKFTLH